MKRLLAHLLSLVLIALVILAFPVQGEEAIYDSVVRLHVLPASDGARDQATKILVRDAVLSEYGEALASLKSSEEARVYLSEHLYEMESFIKERLAAEGVNASVSVTLEKEYFETRDYGALTLPSGTYTSLSIRLDEGEGQNWWCVLYPALCTEAALGEQVLKEEIPLDDPSRRLITESGYIVKFRTLELLDGIFGK